MVTWGTQYDYGHRSFTCNVDRQRGSNGGSSSSSSSSSDKIKNDGANN